MGLLNIVRYLDLNIMKQDLTAISDITYIEKDQDYSDWLQEEIKKKPEMIIFSNTSSYKKTMMVEFPNTSSTSPTVFTS